MKIKKESKKLGIFLYNLQTSGFLLHRLLNTDANRTVKRLQFDRFIHSIPVWCNDRETLLLRRGQMLLRHPSDPSGEGMMEFLRHCTSAEPPSSLVRGFTSSQHRAHTRFFALVVVETAQRLAQDGRREQARWALDFARMWRPEVMTMQGFEALGTRSNEGIPPKLGGQRYDEVVEERGCAGDEFGALKFEIYANLSARRDRFARRTKPQR
jgi:hypothetical protein